MERETYLEQINFEFDVNPAVAILGPRQCGKTTLAKQYIAKNDNFPRQNYFDLENNEDLQRLVDPTLTLRQLTGLILIDEIQKRPELFPTLRVLIDDASLKQRYLILGSASRDLIKQSSETLAGRISYVELPPFTLREVNDMNRLWIRGGFPRSYLAKSNDISFAWRKAYIKTYLEKDIPQLGLRIPAENLRRFWMMLAHYHGCIFNVAEIARSLGLSNKTISHYADILAGTFMNRHLQPWTENVKKRQVKSPKINIRDSGIFHALLGIHTKNELLIHPKLGASWECFALEEIIRSHQAAPEDCYFWSTYQEAELDLLIMKNGKRLGFEIKHTSSPKLTKSMRIALEDLTLDSLTVIYPGSIDFPLTEKINVVGLENYLQQNQ